MKFASWRVSARFAAPIAAVVCALALQACGGGGGDKADPVVTPSDSKTQTVTSGAPAQVSIATGGVLQVGDASAQVSLPADAMVDAATGAAVTGEVTVTLSTINPAADPHDMVAGRYEAIKPGTDGTETELIESFGAITVTLNQGERQLQLAKGKTATIRIPVQSRSTERPATMPLYYWDEDQAIWIQEGSATLKRDPATGKDYYEGTVSHFTTWNADKPIDESVKISGCVQATPGVPADASSYEVYTDGQDYSGLAWGSNTGGNFTVLAKKGGSVVLHVLGQGREMTRELPKVSADTTLSECFVLSQATNSSPEAFTDLITTLSSMTELVLRTSAPVNMDASTMLAPADVCQSGTVSGVTLDSKPVSGGEVISAGVSHKISASFKQCLPSPTASELPDDVTDILDGQYTVNATYTGSGATLSIEATAGLSAMGLQDSTTGVHIVGNGVYGATLNTSSTQTATSVTPAVNAQLTNVNSGNTLSFTGTGKHTISVQFSAPGVASEQTLAFNKLGYKLNGATYVLDGSLTVGAGTVTLSKNGSTIATLTVNASGSTVTGVVDPF